MVTVITIHLVLKFTKQKTLIKNIQKLPGVSMSQHYI